MNLKRLRANHPSLLPEWPFSEIPSHSTPGGNLAISLAKNAYEIRSQNQKLFKVFELQPRTRNRSMFLIITYFHLFFNR